MDTWHKMRFPYSGSVMPRFENSNSISEKQGRLHLADVEAASC